MVYPGWMKRPTKKEIQEQVQKLKEKPEVAQEKKREIKNLAADRTQGRPTKTGW